MKFKIKHEIRGRIRLQSCQKKLSCEQADALQYYLSLKEPVESVDVQERTGNIVIRYTGERDNILRMLREFCPADVKVPEECRQSSSRRLNQEYWDKLINRIVLYYGSRLFIPYPLRAILTAVKSIKYIKHGLETLAKGKIEVPVLDGTAIAISMVRGNINTASSIMFLLGIGEILEEWTHKKSVDDLASSMSLNISKVWLVRDGQEVLVPVHEIQEGDLVRVHMGNVIPFDGTVTEGEAMVNQASLTGEALPVRKCGDGYVYAGTVVEEGEITLRVKEINGSSRFEKIVTMIEESERLKSTLESKAEHLADKLVPYTLLGTGLTYLLTRNTTKALSVLMVDFSCALKLAMPISVLSAIGRPAATRSQSREANPWKPWRKRIPSSLIRPEPSPRRSRRWWMWYPLTARRRTNCSGQPPVWKNIFHIPWRKPWYRRPWTRGLSMRNSIPKWNISLPMAFPQRLMIRK